MDTFCQTEEALKRLLDGDIIENVEQQFFLRKDNHQLLMSYDCVRWQQTDNSFSSFFSGGIWRSLSNLSYYQQLKEEDPQASLSYLTEQDTILPESHPNVDKTKRRWFKGGILN